MASILTTVVQNTLQNAASGFVTSGVATVGTYAGDGISGVGNMIDRAGEGVGNSIAGKIDGWGSAISAYGASVQNATAPNSAAGNYKKPVQQKKTVPKVTGVKTAGVFYTPYSPSGNNKKKPEPKKSPVGSTTGQSLTSSNLKALSGPSTGEKKFGTPSIAGTVASKATIANTYRSSRPPILNSTKTPNGKVRISNESKPGYKAPSQLQARNKTEAGTKPGYKSSTQGGQGNNNKGTSSGAALYTPSQKNANGKVVMSKQSNPYAVKPSYKPPAPVASGQKYQGPLALPSGIGEKDKKQQKSSGASTVGGGQKKYEGPLNLSGVAPSGNNGANANANKKPDTKKSTQKTDGPQHKTAGYDFF